MVAGLFLICLAGGILIAADYQKGLAIIFWFCILAGIGAFLYKNFIKPEALFFLFLFATPLMNIFPSELKYALPLGSLLLIFLVVSFFRRTVPLKNVLYTANGRLLMLYVFLNVIILPFSVDKATSLTYLVSFPLIILLWDWTIQTFNSEDKIIKIVKAFNLIGVFYSVLGILLLVLQYLGVSLTAYTYYLPINRFIYNISSVFPNTNTHGMLLSFTLPCAFYLLLENRKSAYYWFSFLLMGLNLFLSFSRSSWGASALAVGIIFLFKYKDKYKKLIPITVAVIVVLALSLPLIAKTHIDFGKFSEGLLSLRSRGLLWDSALQAISAHPLSGYGAGNSVAALNQYSIYIEGRTPHNTFLRMWVEMGFFGMLIYVAFLFNLARTFFRVKRKSLLLVTVFAILAGSLFQQFFESMLLAGLSIIGSFFLIFSALLEALSQHEDRPYEKIATQYGQAKLPMNKPNNN